MSKSSIFACSSYTILYVGSLYTIPRLLAWIRRKPFVKHRTRDQPQVISERLVAVCVSTIVNMVATTVILKRTRILPDDNLFRTLQTFEMMGIALPKPTLLTSRLFPFEPSLPSYLARVSWICLKAIALTACMYLGTFFVNVSDKWYARRDAPNITSLQRLRNLVIVRNV